MLTTKMIPRITNEILPKIMKISHNSALKVAILDFRERSFFFQNDPFMTLLQHAKNENDAMNNKGDIAQNVENRP